MEVLFFQIYKNITKNRCVNLLTIKLSKKKKKKYLLAHVLLVKNFNNVFRMLKNVGLDIFFKLF